MEEKNVILNQLAFISDLFEKSDMEYISNNVNISLRPEEYNRIFKIVTKKMNFEQGKNEKVFSLKIGDVLFTFNMSNV